jgi:hypothetical protein
MDASEQFVISTPEDATVDLRSGAGDQCRPVTATTLGLVSTPLSQALTLGPALVCRQEFWREYAQNDPEQHLCGFAGHLVGMGGAAQEEQKGHLFAEGRWVSVSAELASALCCIDEDTEAVRNGHEHSRVVLVVRVGSLLNAGSEFLDRIGERRRQ